MGGIHSDGLAEDVGYMIVGNRKTSKYQHAVRTRGDIVFLRPSFVPDLVEKWMQGEDIDLKAELEQLRKENAALKKEFASGIRLKVSGKGAVSVYGLRRSPVTLYKELKLLDRSSDIRAFIAANKTQLKATDR